MQFMRIMICFNDGGASFSWIRHELDRLKAIQGFKLAVVSAEVMKGPDTPFYLWAEPELNGTGWQHVGA